MRKCLILMVAMFLVACGNTVEVDGVKLTYEELNDKIDELKEQEKEYTENLTEIIEAYNAAKTRFDELEELEKNRDKITDEVNEKETELTDLKASIKEKEDRLKTLEGEIIKVKEEPLRINAGYFYFGSDIEPGRYVVKPQGNNNGNFFVRGTNRVNIILGNRNDYLKEFTFEAFDGDELETKIPVELYLVE